MFSAAFSNEHSFGTGIAGFIGVKTMWKRRCKVYFLIKVGPAPRTKDPGKINLTRLGLATFIEKNSISGKASKVWHGVCTVSISQKFVDWRMI